MTRGATVGFKLHCIQSIRVITYHVRQKMRLPHRGALGLPQQQQNNNSTSQSS